MLYEINTRCWLRELSDKAGHPIRLNDIPEEEIERWKSLGFTHIWPMGIWTVGPRAREEALKHWRGEFASSEEDVQGSPYAIKDYSIDPRLGDPLSILLLRDRLRGHGLKLILDFIPNHFGIDSEEPYHNSARFVQSSEPMPGTFERKTKFGQKYFAHGRDPNFEPWADTVQIDYRVADAQAALAAIAQTLAACSDGLRCDMAMLLIPEIFENTWRKFFPDSHRSTARDFWRLAIPLMKHMNPGTDLIAEAYWDKEAELQQAGFDFTYNKRVTDLLVHRQFAQLQEFLLNCKPEYLNKSVHFLENHDEQRIASILPLPLHKAAALLILALPGLPLLHDGQMEGRKIFARIQMNKRAQELPDAEIRSFYERMLVALPGTQVRKGKAQILLPEPSDTSAAACKNVIAILWSGADDTTDVAVVNLGQEEAMCAINTQDSGRKFLNSRTLLATSERFSIHSMAENKLTVQMPAEAGEIIRLSSE